MLNWQIKSKKKIVSLSAELVRQFYPEAKLSMFKTQFEIIADAWNNYFEWSLLINTKHDSDC